MSSQHTPGPWYAQIHSAPLFTRADIYGPPNGFRQVTEIRSSFGSDEEKAANARLIAAAPELLEALRGVVELATMPADLRDACRSAITKATT